MAKKISDPMFIVELMTDVSFIKTINEALALDECESECVDITKCDNAKLVLNAYTLIDCDHDDKDIMKVMDNLEERYGRFGVLFICTLADILEQDCDKLKKMSKSDLVIETFAMHKGYL